MKHYIEKIYIIISLLSIFFIHAQTHSYIEMHRNTAEQLSSEYGIPSAVILAIAFVETGGGNSKGAKVYHNHFGIQGKNTVTKSKYKSYSSHYDNFRDFCKIISNKKYYPQLKGNTQHTEWIDAIAKSGYTAHPSEWKKRIISVINKYKL